MASFKSCEKILAVKEKKSSSAIRTPNGLVNLDIMISPL
jgi:hypothetical protein